MTLEQETAAFWRWFREVCGRFGLRFENEQLLRELDARITQLGGFAWELGPGVKDESNSALVLSPCGDLALLAETRRIVAAAPVCPGWEFYAAKPPKKWARRFVLQDTDGSERVVDAGEARYVLLRYPDGAIGVSIADRNLAALPADLQQVAAEVLLDGELGEEGRMVLVHDIAVTAAFDNALQSKSNAIELLERHLRSVAR